MKNLFSLSLLATAMVLFTSCAKDDENDNDNNNNGGGGNSSNELVIGSDNYVLAGGFIEDYGTSDPSDSSFAYQGTNFDVYLYSDGLNYDVSTDEFAGDGFIIYFESFSSNANAIAAGTYTFDENSLATGTFDIGVVGQIQGGTINQNNTYQVVGGSYTVVVNSTNNYKIEGTLSTLGGGTAQAQSITFSYSGAFSVY